MVELVIFLVGILVGRFLEVVMFRLPNRLPIFRRDIFCAMRRKKSGYRYRFVELVTASSFVLLLTLYNFSWEFLFNCMLISILITIIMIDYDYMIIPNELVISLIVPAVVSVFIYPEVGLSSRVIGFFVVSAPMYILVCIVQESFGGGDIKLMAVAGFMLGVRNVLIAMFIGIMLGGIYAIGALIGKKLGFKQQFAFGPALCVGIFAAMNFGSEIFSWYLGMF